MIIELRNTSSEADGVGEPIAAWQLQNGFATWIGENQIPEFARELSNLEGVPVFPSPGEGVPREMVYAEQGLTWMASLYWQYRFSSRIVARCYDGEGTGSVPILVNGEWKMVAVKDYAAGVKRGVVKGPVMAG